MRLIQSNVSDVIPSLGASLGLHGSFTLNRGSYLANLRSLLVENLKIQ